MMGLAFASSTISCVVKCITFAPSAHGVVLLWVDSALNMFETAHDIE